MLGVTPYYQDAYCTLYHGDCRDILPSLPKVDLVLTDPPWRASKESLRQIQGGVAPSNCYTLSYGALGEFDPSVITACVKAAEFDCLFLCGYKELAEVITAAAPHRGVFVWHKPNGPRAVFYPAAMDAAFIVWAGKASKLYGFQHWNSSVFSIPVPSAGCMKTERLTQYKNGPAVHPAQGPIELYITLLRPFRDTPLIALDPYSGTGTTLVAAKQLGISAIGIEIEERYCEIAAKHIEAATLELFEPGPEQMSLEGAC